MGDNLQLAWVTTYAEGQQSGGWQGMHYRLLEAVRAEVGEVAYVGPLVIRPDACGKWRSRALTALMGRRLVWSASERSLGRYRDAFESADRAGVADAYLFFGTSPYLATVPARPYASFTDSAFVPFLEDYHRERNYADRDMDRLDARERHWLGGCCVVFTTSGFARRAILDRYRLAPESVVCVHAGPHIDTDPGPRTTPRGDGTELSVVFVSTDFERKGGRLAIEAMEIVRRSLPRVRLDIMGRVPGDVQSDGVACHGWIDTATPGGREQYARVMRDGSLFLCLSTADLTPAAVCEALAFGLPVVARAAGGIPEMIDEGRSGWLLPYEARAADVAACICGALADAPALEERGRAARLAYESTWNWRAVAQTIVGELSERTGRMGTPPQMRDVGATR